MRRVMATTLLVCVVVSVCAAPCWADTSVPGPGALGGHRYRVVVSTDIGGSDEDDIQSMVHYLLYSDLFDTEGLISSPPHKGRARDILKTIDVYEKDYANLKNLFQNVPNTSFFIVPPFKKC